MMLDFKTLRLKDKAWVQPILAHSGLIGSENAFGTLWIWAETFQNRVALMDNTLFVSSGVQRLSYHYPMTDDLREALALLIGDSKARDCGDGYFCLLCPSNACVRQRKEKKGATQGTVPFVPLS